MTLRNLTNADLPPGVTLRRVPMKRKRTTSSAADRKWFAAVAELEYCALCHEHGVQVAHRDFGKGMGLKTKAWETAPLCPGCHRDLTDGTQYTRDQKRAWMDRAIVNTHSQLIAAGKLRLA